jgi:hypothetical protein
MNPMKTQHQSPRVHQSLKTSITTGLHFLRSPAALALTVFFALVQLARAQVNELVNPGFEQGATGWTTTGSTLAPDGYNNHPVITTPGPTYDNSATGECPQDPTAEPVTTHSGSNVGNIFGPFFSNPSTAAWVQTIPAAPGGTWSSGGWTYASHEDLSGLNQYHYEVDFFNSAGTLLAAYQSFVVENLTCDETTPFPLDTWVFLPVTNEMQVTAGVNTGVVTGSITTNGITAPADTASVSFQAIFVNVNFAGGSIYLDDCELDLVSGAVPPSVSAINVNGIILSTNTTLTCTASSTSGAITNVQAIVKTSTLGATTSTTVTNNLNSSTSGLGSGSADISYALKTNLIYNVTIVATDNSGNGGSATATFDTISPALVIEAEDFNYSGGGYTNTPANGGLSLYHNQVGVQSVDENKQHPGNGVQGDYRPGDAVVIQFAAPDNGTEQKYVTAAANGDTNAWDVPQEVGFNTVGDWVDYTRDFGPAPTNSAAAGTYYIYGRLASDGAGINGLNFYQITSNPTQSDQSSNLLGNFSFNDTDWNGYFYVPLVDQFGNLVSVTLNGHETLRETMVNNVNCDFYMLVSATPILTPALKFVYPDGIHPFEPTNSFTFTVGAANGAGIESSGIGVVLNGVNITSKLTLTGATNSWTANYPILSNTVYAAVINVTNSAGLTSAFTVNFDTFNPNNFQWEASDYDFTTNGVSGLFIDNPVPSCDVTAPGAGEEATNGYFGFPANLPGAVATEHIDFFCQDPQPIGQGNDYYRADGQGSQPAADYVRPKFLAAQTQFSDPNIGPINLGFTTAGDWENYTRHYPSGNFYVYGRIAGGATTGTGAFEPWSGEQLDLVTSGYGTTNQATNILGTFSDPTPAGYQAWHWIPCLQTNGEMVVVSLGGKATLQIVCGSPGINEEFYMLVPAPSVLTLGASIVNGQLNISIPTQAGNTYQVMYSSALATPPIWSAVGSVIVGNGSVINVSEPLSGTQGYYSVKVQ